MAKSKRYKSVSDYCKQNGLEPYQIYEFLQKDKKLSEQLTVDEGGERQLPTFVLERIGRKLKGRAEEIQRKRRTSPNSAAVAIADEINSLAKRNEELTKEVGQLKAENEHLKEILSGKCKNRKEKVEV